jgi:hypothetical protein
MARPVSVSIVPCSILARKHFLCTDANEEGRGHHPNDDAANFTCNSPE